MKNASRKIGTQIVGLFLIFTMASLPIMASSHAEAPMISMDRYADNSDIYAFRSLESGRAGYVTLIANYVPLQDASGGPQFYRFDDTVLYEIKIDNTGDGREDISYQFQFHTQTVNNGTVLGHTAVNQNGIVSGLSDPDYNMPQTYTVRRVDHPSGRRGRIIAAGLRTPPANVGPRVTPNYEANLGQPAVYPIPGGGKVFAGQRDEGFFIDLGAPFDVINYRSLARTGGVDTLRGKNVNSIAIEVPISDLTRNHSVPTNPTDPNAVIGVFAIASRRSLRVHTDDGPFHTGGWVQVSRLGNPLINEVVVPLGFKDAFNGLSPALDFTVQPVVNAVLDPELPKLIELALETYGTFNGTIVTLNIPPAPRTDIAAIFVTGIPAGAVPGLPNYTTFLSDGRAHEMMRLNVAIAPTPTCGTGYSNLGLLGGDPAGFPNGRRPGDDVVDIEVRALLGGTPFTPPFNVAPNNAFGDGVATNFEGFLSRFPYLQTPNQGNQPSQSNFPATQVPCSTSLKEG